jgi:hypothetical protein
VGLALALGLAHPSAAAVVECESSDVACLIAAINTTNASGGANTIRLQPGTYTLTAPDNSTPADGSNGLPLITRPLTIVGAGADTTIIERAATAPNFRLFSVAQTGLLKLEGLTVRGGRLDSENSPGGGALLNRGTAIISQSALTNNRGGGILSSGRVVIAGSIISDNNASTFVSGGISMFGGMLTVVDSTIRDNIGNLGGGLFIGQGTMAIIIGSTIANNLTGDGNGGGVFSESTAVAIVNSTLAGNRTTFNGGGISGGGGIIVNTTIADNRSSAFGGDALSTGSALALYNTIVAGLPVLGRPACLGQNTSLGNNLFTDPSCVAALLSDDRTGDPRLGDFTDNGTPGHGFLPLLRGSPAINAGDNAVCLPADQLGRPRRGRNCDIGAIEGTGLASHRFSEREHLAVEEGRRADVVGDRR